jgi:hypothetical protein
MTELMKYIRIVALPSTLTEYASMVPLILEIDDYLRIGVGRERGLHIIASLHLLVLVTGLVVVISYLAATFFYMMLMASFERIPNPQLGIVSNGDNGGDKGIYIYNANLKMVHL